VLSIESEVLQQHRELAKGTGVVLVTPAAAVQSVPGRNPLERIPEECIQYVFLAVKAGIDGNEDNMSTLA